MAELENEIDEKGHTGHSGAKNMGNDKTEQL